MTGKFSYSEYLDYFERLVKEGKTSGAHQSEDLINYTKLNWSRSKRIDKTLQILPEVKERLLGTGKSLIFKIITEPWCGDAAQIVPVIAGLGNALDNVEVELVLRDQNEDLMNRYLTNGGKSIPITVIIDKATGEELGSWGPRPAHAQKMVMEFKAMPEEKRPSYYDFVQEVQKWYNDNKTEDIQIEFSNKVLELVK